MIWYIFTAHSGYLRGFCKEKEVKDFWGQDRSRLSAARSLLQRYKLHGYRRGGTFESPKVPKSDLG
jgi:hypothetical protein